MQIGKLPAGLTVGAVVVALLPAAAQRTGTRAMTADDHVQIQQLVTRFGYALDTGANDGGMFADLFAQDGVFGAAKGRAQLAALARMRGDGDANRHFVSNVVITPTEGGATGTQYEVLFAVGGDGRPGTIARTGRYEDIYTRTAAGWRIQKRELYPSISTVEAARAAVPQAPASGGQQPPVIVERQRTGAASTLTALDYLEIQQLVASYGHALDNGLSQTDNGPAYAGLFTPDGVAFQRVKGSGALAAIARAEPHGPRFVRHILTNVTIAPSPEGATGEQYLVVVDPPESGKPGRLFLGGHYEDIYTKTAAGWRYKSRTLFAANIGAETPSTLPPSEAMPAAVRVAAAGRAEGAKAFTAEDYVEIQQLVARYAFALDTADNDGYTYADLFTADGTFNDTRGRDALAALARGPSRGPLHVRNYGALAIIQPTADGATGIQYVQTMDFQPGGRTGVLDRFGRYEDVYVRTAQGWRFKSRRFANESQTALEGANARTVSPRAAR
ncbi:MAG TPA: nuclear transport factor 2 family protein [Vicinamibacterales bacterium]|nr:nuclear transport factor 2 family protein [Vicinamibacterales bacterium]